MNILKKIDTQVKKYNVLIYMKGTPKVPRCGFSAQTIKILLLYKKKIHYVDVLENEDIRIFLPKYSNWPTFPQVFINGELIGGCDIITEMHKNKNLKNLLM
ncbi:Grx4 family monothiol glutaredoxin [Buchnera aphidicola (Mollitrichosiphum nigrofasciatum)]|uniref:Grx4 family monothiol glutaredoxin n=1 Tax=Buchnera aphidicola TaxID=9 RepID=UPI0031B7F339